MSDWPPPVVHREIEARDPERPRSFYAELFHLDIRTGPIMTIAPGLGGPEPGPGGHLRQGDRPGVRVYVQILDLPASLKRVAAHGGTVRSAPFDVPVVPAGPTIAFVEDPEGNARALVEQ